MHYRREKMQKKIIFICFVLTMVLFFAVSCNKYKGDDQKETDKVEESNDCKFCESLSCDACEADGQCPTDCGCAKNCA